ncbi:MAG: glycosyltransferase [Elusimicrobiota bacterium]|jgi:glycosyltransferase involved in cell wall biosynthesis|nr:glycosyltransferase [Elusimicrobiota bacterium]
MTNIKVSVIIPTYNREALLVNTIKYLLKQNFEYEYEIIIVDQTNNHESETQKFLNEIQITQKNKIKYFLLEKPSLTSAKNFGIKNAKSDILIFVDDDISCDENFVKNYFDLHNEGFDVIQGRIIEQGSENKIKSKPTWIYPWIKFKGGNNCLTRGKTNNISGCNFSISKKVVEKVGYFDERYIKIATREDSDYGYRCYKAKMKMIFDPKPFIFHYRSDSGGVESGIKNQFFDQTFYDCHMLFASKHFLPIFKWIYFIRLYKYSKRQLYKMIRDSYKKSKFN